MVKKIILKTAFIFLVLACFEISSNNNNFATSASTPSKLGIYVGPTSVLADNTVYNAIFVQLQAANGAPVRAPQDTAISLSSSLTNIGTVEPTITIPKGSTYASAKLHSTFTPGSTTITAAASGYVTVQASMTTVGPVPSVLALFAAPPTLPADGNAYSTIIVQLQDTGGSPAKAPIGDIQVTLSSANTAIGTVDPSVTIRGGSTYANATFHTISSATGSAVITAIASGYTTGTTTITTQLFGGSPARLAAYLGPPRVPADGVAYNTITVQLQDQTGKIANASSNIVVTLSSSTTDVGTVQPTVMIPQGSNYGIAQFYSTFRSGSTIVTAMATNCTSSQQTITTVGPVPSKLAVFCVPPSLPADNQAYDAIQVQLQDSSGRPAKDPVGNITVFLFSSAPQAGNVNTTLSIPFGSTYSTGTFSSTYVAGSTSITAQTSGYDPGQAQATTYVIDQSALEVHVTADPSTVRNGNQSTIRAYVTYDGEAPTMNAIVQFTSDKGGNFSATTEEGNGYYSSLFAAPSFSRKTNCTITATVKKSGYDNGTGTVQVTIDPSSSIGTVQLQVTDGNGNPISDALVTSITQPPSMSTLNGITNQTGYTVFADIIAGTYGFQITKEGYSSQNQTIQFAPGQTTFSNVVLSKIPSIMDFFTPTTIAIIVAIIAVITIIAIVIKRRPNEDQDQNSL
jgi:hypothetical protein